MLVSATAQAMHAAADFNGVVDILKTTEPRYLNNQVGRVYTKCTHETYLGKIQKFCDSFEDPVKALATYRAFGVNLETRKIAIDVFCRQRKALDRFCRSALLFLDKVYFGFIPPKKNVSVAAALRTQPLAVRQKRSRRSCRKFLKFSLVDVAGAEQMHPGPGRSSSPGATECSAPLDSEAFEDLDVSIADGFTALCRSNSEAQASAASRISTGNPDDAITLADEADAMEEFRRMCELTELPLLLPNIS